LPLPAGFPHPHMHSVCPCVLIAWGQTCSTERNGSKNGGSSEVSRRMMRIASAHDIRAKRQREVLSLLLLRVVSRLNPRHRSLYVEEAFQPSECPAALFLRRVRPPRWYAAHPPRSPLRLGMVRGRLRPARSGGLSVVAFEASLSGLQPREFRVIRLPRPGSDRFVICNGLGTSPPVQLLECMRAPGLRNSPSVPPAIAAESLSRLQGLSLMISLLVSK
jgi:hypothetical protein